jgi:hypothetical protein
MSLATASTAFALISRGPKAWLQEVEIGSELVRLQARVVMSHFRVDCLDQTGQVVVERPSKDEDNESTIGSVVPELGAQLVPIGPSAAFLTGKVQVAADLLTHLRATDQPLGHVFLFSIEGCHGQKYPMTQATTQTS